MNRRYVERFLMLFLPLLLILSAQSRAQSAPVVVAKDPLFAAVAAQDKKLFDAYNTCDLKTLSAMVSEDLEFYHDKTGLAVGRATFLDSISKNICGNVTRELVQSSLEVYPLAGYGAVEIGTHRFHHPWTQDHGVEGEAKFVTLWRNNGGVWTVTRVISYDHAGLQQPR